MSRINSPFDTRNGFIWDQGKNLWKIPLVFFLMQLLLSHIHVHVKYNPGQKYILKYITMIIRSQNTYIQLPGFKCYIRWRPTSSPLHNILSCRFFFFTDILASFHLFFTSSTSRVPQVMETALILEKKPITFHSYFDCLKKQISRYRSEWIHYYPPPPRPLGHTKF